MGETVRCIKLGVDAEGLDFAPWPGELGKRLHENVSKEAWQEWLTHQTRLMAKSTRPKATCRSPDSCPLGPVLMANGVPAGHKFTQNNPLGVTTLLTTLGPWFLIAHRTTGSPPAVRRFS